MKFSVNWLSEFVDLPANVDDIAELLTLAGVETENVEPRGENRKRDRRPGHRIIATSQC